MKNWFLPETENGLLGYPVCKPICQKWKKDFKKI